MPHIHGVAWIAKSELEKRNLSNPICNGKPEEVTKLADKLISCKITDEEDDETQDDEAKKYGHKTLS